MCGNPAPPIIIYEINACGWLIFLFLFLGGFGIFGLIFLCWLCMPQMGPTMCHDPILICASCGMQRGMAMMPIYF